MLLLPTIKMDNLRASL